MRTVKVTFFIAMRNRRSMAPYWSPNAIVSEMNEFLIVSRMGARNEHLTISNAGVCRGVERKAPDDLAPDLVILATLVSQGPDAGEVFLVERDLPPGLTLPGRHVGGEGYIYLTNGTLGPRLRGAARLRAEPQLRSILSGCYFFGNDESGATIHIDAKYVPWVGELLPAPWQGWQQESESS